MTKEPDLIGISPVENRKDLDEFIRFPYKHYAGDEYWVAPLLMQQKELVNTRKNPFYENAEIQMFLARQNGHSVGRIAAIENRAYNRYNNAKTAFFGFFECIDNQFAANLLMRIAGDWAKERGLTKILGPTNPGMMDEIGVLVDGFDKRPAIMMPYSKPWYDKLITGAGFEKAMDLYAYKVDEHTIKLDRFDRAEEIVMRRLPDLKIRPVNLGKFNSEVEIIHSIFNLAWARNWGFYEISKKEFEVLGKELKMIIDTDFAHIAEIKGEPVGFSIALPDLNQALSRLDGRLFPTGLFKLLYYKRKINGIRTALMGIVPEYQGRGIDAMLTRKAVENGMKKGFVSAELGWLLETNTHIIRVAERLGGYREKTYRLYQR